MENKEPEDLIQKFLLEYTARKPVIGTAVPLDTTPPIILYDNKFLKTSRFPPAAPVPIPAHPEITTAPPSTALLELREQNHEKRLPNEDEEKTLLAILASKLRPAGETSHITSVGHEVPGLSSFTQEPQTTRRESEDELLQRTDVSSKSRQDKAPDKCPIGFQSNYVKMVQGSYVVNTTLDHGYHFVLQDKNSTVSESKNVNTGMKNNDQHWHKVPSETDEDSDSDFDPTYEKLVAKLQTASSRGAAPSIDEPVKNTHVFYPELVVPSVDALVLERTTALENAKKEKLASESRMAEAATPQPSPSPTKKKNTNTKKAEDKPAKSEVKDTKEKPAGKGKKAPKDKQKTPLPTSPVQNVVKPATPAVVILPESPPSLVHCYPSSRLALKPDQSATSVSVTCKNVSFDSKNHEISARFLLREKDHLLGVSPGEFILMAITMTDGRKLCRPAFPANPCDTLGFVDIIWDFRRDDTQHLNALPGRRSFGDALLQVQPEEQVTISGPYGQLLYLKNGWISHQQRFSKPKRIKQYKHVLFIGTTFVSLSYYAMVEQACRERASVEFTLLHVGFTEEDFMMGEKLKVLANTSPAICRYYEVLLGSAICRDWKQELEDILVTRLLPPSTDGHDYMVVVCANPPFARNYILPALDAVGLDEETVDRYVYGDVDRDFTGLKYQLQ